VTRPLEGIRVVEIGVWHAGPGTAAILGDLGADVVKVETIGGDPERYFGNFGPMDRAPVDIPDWTPLFELSNRNKRSISVDIGTPDGRAVLDRLLAGCDVLVTNLRRGSREQAKLDYASVSAINEKIVYVAVSAFGPAGELASAGGFDPLGQAFSGMVFLADAEEPKLLQMVILDQLTAITASHATVTALLSRERTGAGQEVDVSLYGSATWLLAMNIFSASVLGFEMDTAWDRTRNPPLRTTYRCGDGKWIFGSNHPEAKYWPPFCDAIGRPELTRDERFDTSEARAANAVTLIGEIDATISTASQEHWLAAFAEHGLLFAPVRRPGDVLTDEQARANNYVTDFRHPALGDITIPGFPMTFGGHEVGPHRPAPGLGEHTDEILHGLGYEPDAVAELRTARVVR
jgi:crotonobetainyl-CoA:carnitine CoA-transferase CaiB-like acyl-CoA transferase